MNKLVELFPDFDFHDEELDSWDYDCWLAAFSD